MKKAERAGTRNQIAEFAVFKREALLSTHSQPSQASADLDEVAEDLQHLPGLARAGREVLGDVPEVLHRRELYQRPEPARALRQKVLTAKDSVHENVHLNIDIASTYLAVVKCMS